MKWVPVILPNGSLNVFAVLDGRTPTLEWLQEQVGGYIETTPTCLSGLVMVVNEEGKLMGLPINDTATDLLRDRYECIAGNAVIMEVDGPELAPLDLKDLAKIAAFAASSNISTRRMEPEEEDDE